MFQLSLRHKKTLSSRKVFLFYLAQLEEWPLPALQHLSEWATVANLRQENLHLHRLLLIPRRPRGKFIREVHRLSAGTEDETTSSSTLTH